MAGPAKSNQEVFAPDIRPDFVGLIRFVHPAGQPSAVTALRYVSSLHHCSRGTTGCGPPTKGHPWPIAALAALAASMPLNPLTRFARPSGQPAAVTPLRFVSQRFHTASWRGVWHGCHTRNDGRGRLGWGHRDDTRNSAGARVVERSETRMSGAHGTAELYLQTRDYRLTNVCLIPFSSAACVLVKPRLWCNLVGPSTSARSVSVLMLPISANPSRWTATLLASAWTPGFW